MGKRTVVLVVALVLAGIAAFSVWVYLNNVEDDIRADIAEEPVFRATARIEAGVEGSVARPLIEEKRELSEFVPPNAVQNIDELEDLLDGAVTALPIGPQQVITTDMFVAPEDLETATLSGLLDEGKVAVAMQLSQVQAAGGWLAPGDNVSLLASDRLSLEELLGLIDDEEIRSRLAALALTPAEALGTEQAVSAPPTTQVLEEGDVPTAVVESPAAEGSLIPIEYEYTETVLQEVQVLAVGSQVREVTPGAGIIQGAGDIIMLEVSPQQAEVIAWLQQYATVDMVLVPEGYLPVGSQGVIVDDVFTILERLLNERLNELER